MLQAPVTRFTWQIGLAVTVVFPRRALGLRTDRDANEKVFCIKNESQKSDCKLFQGSFLS